MISVLQGSATGSAELSDKLMFQQKLQAVTNKIHSTNNLDEIMVELSQDMCDLFEADRLTIYITHLKPREAELIMEEIAARVPERRPQMLQVNQLFDL